MQNPDSVFISLKKLLSDKLIPYGYYQSEEKFHPEVFGSCFVEYKSEDKAIRLIWDGKDKCFYVQVCIDSQNYPSCQHWKDIVIQPFDTLNQNADYFGVTFKPVEVFLSGQNV